LPDAKGALWGAFFAGQKSAVLLRLL